MLEQPSPTAMRHAPQDPEPDGPDEPGIGLSGLQAMIDPLPEPILVTDASGAVRMTNGAADRLFADRPVQTGADLLSRFEDARPAEPEAADDIGRDRDEPNPPSSPASGDEAERWTVRSRHRPNTWFELDRVPLATDGDGAAFVLQDVSNRGELEAEREAFLAILSHELRTPLTTIYAGSSVLARRSHLSRPTTRLLAMDISLEAARLYDLVENLLVIARLERQILHPLDEPVDLGAALDTAILLVRQRAPGLRIERAGPSKAPSVHGDATYVAQSCRNLILSMIRTPDPASEAALAASLRVDRAAGEVSVTVRADGPTLTAAQLEGAFDLPDSSASGALGRAGMGPFVARRAVEAMGGRAWARTSPGGGLEMGFALRIHEARRGRGRRGEPPPDIAAAGSGASGRR